MGIERKIILVRGGEFRGIKEVKEYDNGLIYER